MNPYPLRLTRDDNGTVLVRFPDFPEAQTFGDDEAEALSRAIDALETAIISRMSDREKIPPPSRPKRGQRTVTLPALAAAKVALYEAMRRQGITKAELGRRLHWHMPQIDRLLDLRHASRLDQLETALAKLGKRLVLEVRRAA
jgi:antitoxin HicB